MNVPSFMRLNLNLFLNSATTLSLVGNKNCCFILFSYFTSQSIFETIVLLFFDQKEEIIPPGGFAVVRGITQIAVVEQFVWKEAQILEEQEDKLKEEARIAQELHSSFIVEIVNSFVEDERLYMVMEYFSDGTLEDLLDEFEKSKKQIQEDVFYFFYFILFYFFNL
jgi:serine/threonine protein kinase